MINVSKFSILKKIEVIWSISDIEHIILEDADKTQIYMLI